MHRRRAAYLALLVLLGAGPAERVNPSFPISRADAKAALDVEAREPATLDRPVVVFGGFLDFGVGPRLYSQSLGRHVRGRIVRVAFGDCTSFEQCRRRAVAAVDAALGPGATDDETVEVDVVGQSMGGLVAMHAAMSDPALGKRLKVRRLFTISSPLQGALRAARVPFYVNPLIRDMRPGSALYARLAREPLAYEIYSYTRLGDRTVGEQFAGAFGRAVWWIDNPPREAAHIGIFGDARVMLDIVRRLGGRPPVTTDPPAPLPTPATRPTTRP